MAFSSAFSTTTDIVTLSWLQHFALHSFLTISSLILYFLRCFLSLRHPEELLSAPLIISEMFSHPILYFLNSFSPWLVIYFPTVLLLFSSAFAAELIAFRLLTALFCMNSHILAPPTSMFFFRTACTSLFV
jgi:hypothetical protein